MSEFFKVNDRFGVNLDKITFWEWYPEDDRLIVYFDHAVTDVQGEVDDEGKALITESYTCRSQDAKRLLAVIFSSRGQLCGQTGENDAPAQDPSDQ